MVHEGDMVLMHEGDMVLMHGYVARRWHGYGVRQYFDNKRTGVECKEMGKSFMHSHHMQQSTNVQFSRHSEQIRNSWTLLLTSCTWLRAYMTQVYIRQHGTPSLQFLHWLQAPLTATKATMFTMTQLWHEQFFALALATRMKLTIANGFVYKPVSIHLHSTIDPLSKCIKVPRKMVFYIAMSSLTQ